MKGATEYKFSIDNDQTRLCRLAQDWRGPGNFQFSGAIDETGSEGMTALHFAAFYGLKDAVTNLIDSGADFNKPRDDGANALHLAAHNGHTDVVRLLLNAGVDVNSITKEHEVTPLHIATHKGHESIVELLLAQPEIEVNKLKKSGETALDLALKAKPHHMKIITLIWNKEGKIAETPLATAPNNEVSADQVIVDEAPPATNPVVTGSTPVAERKDCCAIS